MGNQVVYLSMSKKQKVEKGRDQGPICPSLCAFHEKTSSHKETYYFKDPLALPKAGDQSFDIESSEGLLFLKPNKQAHWFAYNLKI